MTEMVKHTERGYTLTAAREAGWRALERLDAEMALQSSLPQRTTAPPTEREPVEAGRVVTRA